MKKHILLLTALAMILPLTGCDEDEEKTPPPAAQEQSQSEAQKPMASTKMPAAVMASPGTQDSTPAPYVPAPQKNAAVPAQQAAPAAATAPAVSSTPKTGETLNKAAARLVKVENAYAFTAAAGRNGAAFLTIINASQEDDMLVSAEMKAPRSVELHESSMKNGVMNMRPIKSIKIPAGKSITLSPTGAHIMLLGLRHDLREKMILPLALYFEKSGRVNVYLEIKKPGAATEEKEAQE